MKVLTNSRAEVIIISFYTSQFYFKPSIHKSPFGTTNLNMAEQFAPGQTDNLNHKSLILSFSFFLSCYQQTILSAFETLTIESSQCQEC